MEEWEKRSTRRSAVRARRRRRVAEALLFVSMLVVFYVALKYFGAAG